MGEESGKRDDAGTTIFDFLERESENFTRFLFL